jgi:hypothetical protein
MSNFNIKEIQKEKFYRLPKVFFTNPKYTKLSNDAKITWSILRDRLDLSIKNNWIDENGDIFFIYTNEKLKNILNISSPNKLSKIKKELTRADLFSQVRVGLNKPNKLYLKKPEVQKADVYCISQQENDVEQQYSTDVSNSYIQKYDNDTSGNIKMIHHDVQKKYTNDTDYNNTDYIETKYNDTDDLNDRKLAHSNNQTNHSNHYNSKFNDEALKFQLLEELPQSIQSYLSNFSVAEIKIIKPILLKAKTSFNNSIDTYYLLEDMEIEILHVLKRFKAMLIQKKKKPLKAMQGYLMKSLKSEFAEMHTLNKRRDHLPITSLFNQ